MKKNNLLNTIIGGLLGFALLVGLPPGKLAAQPQADPLTLYQEAMAEYGQRRLKHSVELLEQLIKQFPKHQLSQRAKMELARIYIDQREPEKAIDLLTPLVEGSFNDFTVRQARDMLIKTLKDLQRFKAGIDLLEKWREQNPEDIQTARLLANFYQQSGKGDEARVLLEGLLEKTASREVFEDLLKIATKTGSLNQLLSSIEQRRVRYRSVDFLDFVTDCQLALKEEKKAAELLRSSPETATNLVLLKKLARVDLALNDPQKALESFQKINSMMPLDWENLKAAGHCLFLLGKKDEAVRTWKLPVVKRSVPGQEAYQLIAEVFIEHKLFQETLDLFSEARTSLGNPTMFAEERARVLESMDRKPEALEEYFNSLARGLYKPEIFDKLYQHSSNSFNFKARLLESLQTAPNIMLKKALLELFFRDPDPAVIPEILAIDTLGGAFDDILFERIQQAQSSAPTTFLQKLIIAVQRERRKSTLALQLCSCLLALPDQTDAEARESIEETGKTLSAEPCPDILLKTRVMVDLGRFCLERFNDTAGSRKWLESALKLSEQFIDATAPGQDISEIPPANPPPQETLEALILLSRLEACNNHFDAATTCLQKARKLNPQDETAAQLLFAEGWLEAQKGKFQEALLKLRSITTDFPESLWVNDALSLGLLLTMGSSNFDALAKFLAADRALAVGSLSAAIEALNESKTLASDTPLALDCEAKLLQISASSFEAGATNASSPDDLIGKVNDWVLKHPAHWAIPDLYMLKWRLLKRNPQANEAAIGDLLKEFTERFPGDLRSRRAGLALQDLMKNKGKK